jgi:DNA-binding beta-propeller fold protein YncE
LTLVLLLLSAPARGECLAGESSSQRDRSPVDVAVVPGGKRLMTANHGTDSISLVDLASGKVVAEQGCGRRPSAIACSADGRRAAASHLWDGSLGLWEIEDTGMRRTAVIRVGSQPRGLVFSPNGSSLFVALAGANEVAQVDLTTRQVLRRWPAPVEPRRLILSRDGRSLIAASARSAQVRCWDTSTGKLLWEKTILDAFNLHGLTLSPDDRFLVAPHVHDRHHPIAKNNIEQGWALDNRLTRLAVRPDGQTEYWQIGLDLRGHAVADPGSAAFSDQGDWLAVTAAGTQELVILRSQSVPWCSGDPGDFLDPSLAVSTDKFRRVNLGGRPLAVQFVAGSNQAVVANYLLNALQVVDAPTGRLVHQINLGGPTQPSLARVGETIFL